MAPTRKTRSSSRRTASGRRSTSVGKEEDEEQNNNNNNSNNNATKSESLSSTMGTSITTHLVEEMYGIASNSARCSFALEALLSGNKQQSDTRVMSSCTFLVNRMISYLSQSNTTENSIGVKVATSLAALCFYLSRALLSDRPRLERCSGNGAACSSSSSPRCAVARAIVSTTLGSVLAMDTLASSENLDKDFAVRGIHWAVDALETVVNFSYKVTTLHRCEVPRECLEAMDGILSPTETKLLKKMTEEITSDVQPPPTKRRRKASEDVPLAQFLSSYPEENITFDGRVSIRRWAAMAFVWLSQGQLKLLHVIRRILASSESWRAILVVSSPKAGAPRITRHRKNQKVAQPPPAEPEQDASLTHDSDQISLSCRLLELCSEAGTSCGVRSPTGGMEVYTSLLLRSSPDDVRPPARSRRTTNPRSIKVERVDLRTLATCVVQLLIETHAKSMADNNSQDMLFSLEDASASQSKLVKAIDLLNRLVANSVPNSAHIDVSDSISRMSAISSAYILNSCAVEDLPINADLIMHSISRFSAALSSLITSYSDPILESTIEKTSIQKYLLSKSISPDEAEPNSTFAGIFEEKSTDRMSNGVIISLFLRAMHNSDTTQDTPKALADKLLFKLFHILKCCYSSSEKFRSLRVTLGTDTLNTLRKCLVQRHSSLPILKLFRDSITPTHISQFVFLGKDLDKFLFSTKDAISLPDRQLWCNHVKLCLTIGRGQPSFDYKKRGPKVIMGDATCRLQVFEAIDKSLSETEWLCLPSFHHAILTSNLTSEPIASMFQVASSAPESFICVKIRDAIKKALSDLDALCKVQSMEEFIPLSLRDARLFCIAVSRTSRSEQAELLSDIVDYVHDFVSTRGKELMDMVTNTFITSFFARLLTTIVSLIDIITVGANLAELLMQQTGPTHYHLPNNGDGKKDEDAGDMEWYKREKCYMGIFADWESPATPSHSIIDATEALSAESLGKLNLVLDSFLELGFESGKYDNMFLLFASWNAKGKWGGWDRHTGWTEPCASKAKSLNNPNSHAVKLYAIREDITHLHRKINPMSPIKRDSLFTKLLLAKEEKKGIFSQKSYSVIEMLKRGVNDAVLMMDAELHNFGKKSSTPAKMDIGKIMALNLDILTNEHHTGQSATENPTTTKEAKKSVSLPPSTFAYLEGLVIYLSFLTSQFTIHDEDIFSTNCRHMKHRNRKRRRKHLSAEHSAVDSLDEDHCAIMDDCDEVLSDDSESNVGYPDFADECDDEECEDARIEQCARLHDACDAIGGVAPVHPDFLDVSCRLRDGVSDGMAIEFSQKILSVLIELVDTAYHQFLINLNTWLEKASSQKSEDSTSNPQPKLAISILSSLSRDCKNKFLPGDSFPPPTRSLVSEIAKMCEVPESVLSLITYLPLDSRNTSEFCNNTNTIIRGKLQELSPAIEGWESTSGELRATGEWELLLSESLLGAFLGNERTISNTKTCSEDKSEGNSSDTLKYPEDYEDFFLALRWNRVLKIALTSMTSCAALLRFGLSNHKGTSPHPLARGEVGNVTNIHTIAPPSPFMLSPELFTYSNVTLHQVQHSIWNALALLGRISSDGLTSNLFSVCKVVSCHLVKDVLPLQNLEGLHCLRLAIASLFKISSNQIGSDVVRCLIKTIEYNADASHAYLDSSDSIPMVLTSSNCTETASMQRLKYWNLLTFLNFTKTLVIDTIVESRVGLTMLYHLKQNNDVEWHTAYPTFKLSLNIICHSFWQSLELKTKSNLATIICGLLECVIMDKNFSKDQCDVNSLPMIMLDAFNSLDSDSIMQLVKEDVCLLNSTNTSDVQATRLSWKLVMLVGYLISTEKSSPSGCTVVFDTLIILLDQWSAKFVVSSSIMDLLCLLATKFNQLKEVGDLLSAQLESDDVGNYGQRIVAFESFLHFIYEAMQSVCQIKSNESILMSISSSNADTKSSQGDPYLRSLLQLGSSSSIVTETSRLRKSPRKSILSTALKKSKAKSDILGIKLRTCSFVETGGDFSEQHWYNCYTCGLLWDKGCCSLCAQVCHRGHDVGYSRRSSFFCDCGAEVTNDSTVTCKCLNPLSAKELAMLHNNSNSSNALNSNDESELKEDNALNSSFEKDDSVTHGREHVVRLAVECIPDQTETAFRTFISFAKNAGLIHLLFAQFHRCFDLWAKNNQEPFAFANMMDWSYINYDRIISSNKSSDNEVSNVAEISSPIFRHGRTLDLSPGKDFMIPVRASKNSLNVENSSETTTERLKKALVSKSNIQRRCVVADSRGRLIISEVFSLLFSCALPLINTRHVDKPFDLLDRAQLCIRGSAKIKFNVLGMQLCPENDRHLICWGTSEACVVVLNKACDSIERMIDLVAESDHNCESDYLLKCEWIPKSETLVAVVFGQIIRLFDMRTGCRNAVLGQEKESICYSTASYTLPYDEISIKSAVFVGENIEPAYPIHVSINKKNDIKDYSVKLLLLLDTGRLCTYDIHIDANGELEDQGESYIECGEGLRFPTGGIRRYLGATPITPGSTSSSFGEGSGLDYLKQSGLLLYKCLSAPLLALKMDSKGKIVGSFELLPHVITAEMLGSGTDGQAISAPFTNFTELGMVKSGDSITYRLSCVGKSTRSGAPKLLSIELNEERITVSELVWPCVSSFVGMSLSLTLTHFSSPQLFGRGTELGAIGNQSQIIERAYLVALYSTGVMLLFGETIEELDESVSSERKFSDVDAMCIDETNSKLSAELVTSLCLTEKETKNKPKFPLTIFETLINISDISDLVYGGDIINTGKEHNPAAVMKKLAISSGDFLVCPSKEGCTLTASLRGSGNVGHRKNCDSLPSKQSSKRNSVPDPLKDPINLKSLASLCLSASSLAIVAVRIVFGNATTDLPRYLTIMGGRKTELKHGVKRWYDIPLTDEEVLLGVRLGCVCIGIGPSFDSSNSPPCVDAVEVYGKKREDIPYLSAMLNQTAGSKLFQNYRSDYVPGSKTNVAVGKKGLEENSRNALLSSIKCIVHACRILQEKVDWSKVNVNVLQQLVQMTVLENDNKAIRNHVLELLKIAEPDDSVRQSLVDKGTLMGVGQSIQALKKMYSDVEDTIPDFESSKKVICIIVKCLKSALVVAQERPYSYKTANNNMVSTLVECSIATDTKDLFDSVMKGRSMAIARGYVDSSASHESNSSEEGELASLLVELLLFEMVGKYRHESNISETSMGCNFADFSHVSEILRSDNPIVVQQCCITIAKVLGEYQSPLLLGLDSTRDSLLCETSRNSKDNVVKEDEPTASSRATQPIAYQCDACELFPIISLRYTLDGDDIDLCEKCYESGSSYALSYGEGTDAVKVNDKTLKLGKNGVELSCSQILQMHPEPVEAISLDQQDMRTLKKSNITSTEEEGDNSNSHSHSLDAAFDSVNNLLVLERDDNADPRALLRNSLFDSLLDESVRMAFFEPVENSSHELPVRNACAGHLLQLILHLVFTAENPELRLERGIKVAIALVTKLSSLVECCLNNKKDSVSNAKHVRISMVVALRTLSKLIRKDNNSSQTTDVSDFEGDGDSSLALGCATKNKDKTNPRFVCNVHGVPAVRRRCSSGVHKDRRFYVCGMDRKVRCKYFKWADEDHPKSLLQSGNESRSQAQNAHRILPSSNGKRSVRDTVELLQAELWKMFSELNTDGISLQSQLCDLLKTCFQSSSDDLFSSNEKKSRKRVHDKLATPRPTTVTRLNSLRTEKDVAEDYKDGIMFSQDKLGPRSFSISENCEKMEVNLNLMDSTLLFEYNDSVLMQASLDLLSLLATNSLPNSSSTANNIVNWSTDWFSLLCKILASSSNSLSNLRSQAKRMLKHLCGGRDAYHRVRDHYVFASQYKKLLDHSQYVLLASMEVIERGRQCGPRYKPEVDFSWKNLGPGALLGIEGLISEDNLTLIDEENIGNVLDELIEVTKTRGSNWRQFCAMNDLPHFKGQTIFNCTHFRESMSDANQLSTDLDKVENFIYDRPPICSLLWLACSLTGPNRVKVLNLMVVALSTPTNTADNAQIPKEFVGNSEHEHNVDDGGSTDGGDSDVEVGDNISFPRLTVDLTPEDVLLDEVSGLNKNEICTLVSQFVLHGKDAELRIASSKVIETLFNHTKPSNLQECILSLMGPLTEVGFFGIESLQLLQLLHRIIRQHGSILGPFIVSTSRIVIECFIQQMRTIVKDYYVEQVGVVNLKTDNGPIVRKVYDLSSCVHCHKVGEPENIQESKANEVDPTTSFSTSRRSSGKKESASHLSSENTVVTHRRTALEKATVPPKNLTSWLPDQVRPYTRSRLESSTERVVSTEFASYIQLKYRLAICEIFLSVSDPRGRLCKTIGIFFSPRQVGDVNELKGEDDFVWQRCGTLSLSRGASRSSCILKSPIIAANLKFEYLEFYEKVGSTKNAEGGILLNCPRCTRVVNNAHGVCGHCGEVAFQCRKCRHINYNVLDAFLCVECGYCSSGGFSFELTAGIASNAVAIVDQEGFDRAMKLLRIAMRRLGDLKATLKKKINAVTSAKQNCGSFVDDNTEEFDKYNPLLKRALLGELPKSIGKICDSSNTDSKSGRRGPASMSSRAQASSRISSASSKARSLLNLARQLRNETEGIIDGDRANRADLRQALLNIGGSGSIEFFEDGPLGESEGDIFGVINSVDNMPDSLSRLVANIQAKVRSSSTGLSSGNDGDNYERRPVSSGAAGASSGETGHTPKTAQLDLEECDQLYQQMREAERESFELQRTVNAWKRLNRDSLVDFGSTPSYLNFVPSLCSTCCDPVTIHILTLILELFEIEGAADEIEVTQDFVRSLFYEGSRISPELHSLKRLMIITLVQKSNEGAKLVLIELSSRLTVTRDPVSAEILGALLEKSFNLSEEYLKLAVEVMESL